ncbi:RNA editing complex protein MP90 [Trypanosoma theileri]|uniref:RNA editing complex protein MP90 n=1 Tax=Trypanosoma theileri TaxID=67003 RepID=A0A1X0NWL3_9TRYP|nr:RNA editing complex protein MP90 [Trypanosoma theileri]ORC89001.1 RNA editing complex protein MP90 [Trypanosoma theileri]
MRPRGGGPCRRSIWFSCDLRGITPQFYSRHFSTSSTRLALERVEVAHSQSYARRGVTVGFTSFSGSATAGGSVDNNLSSSSSSSSANASFSSSLSSSSSSSSGNGGDVLGNYVSFIADDATAPAATKENGAQPMRSLRSPAAAESLFFKDEAKNYCRLCMEETQVPAKTHITTPYRASHTNHTCREVVLDSLALLAIRGYPIDDIYLVWSDILYHEPMFRRIPELVSPRWSITQRSEMLSKLLSLLKDLNVIDISLAAQAPDTFDNMAQQVHHRRRVAFERLEYIGDNSWGNHLSNRMMILFPDRQWTYSQNSYAFNCFRDACEMNVTLEFMFDTLRVSDLLPRGVREKLGTGKIKADVVEAVIGELHVTLWGLEPHLYDSASFVEVNGVGEARLSALVQHCLTEIYDLILLSYVRELSGSAVPLAKEIAASRLWAPAAPPLRRVKTHRRQSTTSSLNTNGTAAASLNQTVDGVIPRSLVAGRLLPPLAGLFTRETPRPTIVPHPLRAIGTAAAMDETVCVHTGRDVFARFVDSFARLGLLDERLAVTMDVRQTRDVRFAFMKRQLVPSLPMELDMEEDLSSSSSLLSSTTTAAAVGGDVGTTTTSTKTIVGEGNSTNNLMLPEPVLELEEVYFRDIYFDLAPLPLSVSEVHPDNLDRNSVSKVVIASPDKGRKESKISYEAQLGMAVSLIYPPLYDTPTHAAENPTTKSGRVCIFAPSVYVPVGTKPPSAGVVTDKNLHFGEFAFLNVCVGVEAQSKASNEEKDNNSSSSNNTSNSHSSTSGDPIGEVKISSESSATTRNDNDNDKNDDIHRGGDAQAGEDIDSATTIPVGEKEGEKNKLESSTDELRRRAQEKWSCENPYFVPRRSLPSHTTTV